MEIQRIYFIGIGGIGMSALARYFLHEGRKVAGYDRTRSALTEALAAEGAAIHYTDDTAAIPAPFREREGTVVVYTPAVPDDHAELSWFRDHGFTVEKRSQMLGHLSAGKYVMAVAGTHGKTTTSTLVAWLNREVEGTGSAFLGGISKNFGSNLVLGNGPRLAVEADEFDRSFLRLRPDVAVVTAVDADHLDIYGTHEAVKEAFAQFIERIRPGGALVLKAGVDVALRNDAVTVYRYAYDTPCDFYARDVQLIEGGHYRYDLVTPSGVIADCTLGIPGWVNVENAVAAVAAMWCAARAEGGTLDTERLRRALAAFEGVKRRFECQYPAAGLHGRLCPPSARTGRRAHLGAADVSRPARDGGLPAAPLHPHARLLPRVRRGAVAGRRSAAAADLSRTRGADRGHRLRDHRRTGHRTVPHRRPRSAGGDARRSRDRRGRQLRGGQHRRLLRCRGGRIA